MQQIFGENYFIDFDEIEKYIDLSLKEDEIQTTGETADQ
jgi:hypothetical protein